MKTPDISRFVKTSVGAALALAFTGATLAQFATSGGTIDLPGTPKSGNVCRGGYATSFGNNVLRCSKTTEIKVELVCAEAPFTNYVVRGEAPGTQNGLDVCAKDKKGKDNDVEITSTSDITGLTKGKDYKFAKADLAKINEKVASIRQEEAAALGLQLKDVDASGGEPSTDTKSGDAQDKSKVTVTLHTFAVPNLGLVSTSRAGSFVPRPLP